MPLPVENLSENSAPDEVRKAREASMEQCMKEGGRTQKECADMIYSIIRDTGARIPEDRG